MNKFPERLRYLRISNNLTQEKLSNDIKNAFGYSIAKSTISQYENGNREPGITILVDFARYFNCSVDYLIGSSDHKNIIDQSEFMSKMLLLKTIVDILPNIDYIHVHELNKLITEYIHTNNLD